MQHKKNDIIGAIVAFIDSYTDENGVSPTRAEIGNAVGITDSTVCKYLRAMEERGIIAFDSHRNPITDRMRRDIADLSRTDAPILGSVACGEPLYAEEFIEDSVRLPKSLFGQGPFFILRANGLSMTGAGIDPGDLVVIRQTNTANPGDIVVALTEDGTTLKRYYPEPENRRIRLQPENESMQPIYCRSITVQGVAVRIIKNIEKPC